MSDIELFIMCIQERPILWDKRNKNYHNRLLSHREWEKLAEINETTSEALKKKWKNLRDTFTRELKKIPKPRSGTDADNEPKYTGTWPYFENMSFLTVVLKPRKTYGNIEQDDDITECDSIDLQERTGDVNVEDISGMDMADNNNTQLSISILQDANFTVMHSHSPSAPTPSPSAPIPSPSAPIPSPSAPIPSPSAPPSSFRTFQEPSPTPAAKKKATKRKRQDDDLQAYMELEREKLKLLREDQQDANDDDLLWFKSILPYMKQLPQMNKLLFRTQMQEHLLNELTKLNNAPQPGQSGYYTSL